MRETIIGSQRLRYLLVSGCCSKPEGDERLQPELGVNRPGIRRVGGKLSDGRRVVTCRVREAGGCGMGIRIALKRLSPAKRSAVQFGLPGYVGLGWVVLSADLHGAKIFECLLLLHAIRRCACWRTNAKGILAVREADPSPLHKTIQRISLQLMERPGCVTYVLELGRASDRGGLGKD